jgi:hypothetical protein
MRSSSAAASSASPLVGEGERVLLVRSCESDNLSG